MKESGLDSSTEFNSTPPPIGELTLSRWTVGSLGVMVVTGLAQELPWDQWASNQALERANVPSLFCRNAEEATFAEGIPALEHELSAARARVEARLSAEGVQAQLEVGADRVLMCDPLPVVIGWGMAPVEIRGTVMYLAEMQQGDFTRYQGVVVMNESEIPMSWLGREALAQTGSAEGSPAPSEAVSSDDQEKETRRVLDHELVHLTQPETVTWWHEAEAALLSDQVELRHEYALAALWWQALGSFLEPEEPTVSMRFRTGELEELIDRGLEQVEAPDQEKEAVKKMLAHSSMQELWVRFSDFLTNHSERPEVWVAFIREHSRQPHDDASAAPFWDNLLNFDPDKVEKIDTATLRVQKERMLKKGEASVAFLQAEIQGFKIKQMWGLISNAAALSLAFSIFSALKKALFPKR